MQKKIEKLKSEKFVKKTDLIIISAVILLALFFLLFSNITTSENSQYTIYVENQLYQTGSLNEDAEIIVQSSSGEVTFVVENGEIYACCASCADGLCEKQGRISQNGSKIICLPNKIVAEISGGADDGIDAVS